MRKIRPRRPNGRLITGMTITGLLGLLLVGCGSPSEADALWIDYQRRLANTLDITAPVPHPPRNLEAFPSREARLFDIAETRQGMLEVYALRECGIISAVAERNSQLGRTALPSQRWVYEQTMWRMLRDCWEADIASHLSQDARQRLQALLMTKTQQLPRLSWNALFDSQEWVQNFSRASQPLSPETDLAFSQARLALDYLRHATLHQFDPTWRLDSNTLESHLQVLQNTAWTARLLRALLLASQRLDEASDALQARLAERPICYLGHSNPSAERLYNVFMRYFIGQVQPYLAELQRSSRLWLGGVNGLLEAHSVSRPAIDRYRHVWLSIDNPAAPQSRFQAALERHILLWQDVWRSCGKLPSTQTP
ncbi:DUF3080 family protein [Halomonas sp. WWR20]